VSVTASVFLIRLVSGVLPARKSKVQSRGFGPFFYLGVPMTDEEFDQILKNISAYGVGITNVPLDISRYLDLGINAAFRELGLVSEDSANIVRDDINKRADRPSFYPDAVNDYREWLASESPEMESLGQVAGGALAGGITRTLPYLLQKGSKAMRLLKAHPEIAVTVKELIEEYGVEPELDEILKYLED
jgi:hypothetical protein